MIRLIVRRLFYMAVSGLVLSLILFLIFELDPDAVALDALGPYTTQEQRDIWLAMRGYNEPAAWRFMGWLANVGRGDLGMSRLFDTPVANILWPRLGNTAILAGSFFAIMVPLSITLGVLAGMREGSPLDRGISFFAIITTSVPPFASAVLFSAIFAYWLDWLPATSTMMDGFSLSEIVLPVMVLVAYDFGYVTRITRTSMADVMATPYVRSARLKGLTNRRIILRHALRNALIAPFTIIMLQMNWLIGGVIVVEFFFAYKGFGSLILEAAIGRDLFLLQACTLVAVVVAIGTQTIADIGYTFLNPRIRFR